MTPAARVQASPPEEGAGGPGPRPPLSTWGRTGMALLFIHVVLLFLQPIPPDVKGSLWSYLAGYLAALLLAIETGRRGSGIRAAWGAMRPGRRATLVLLACAAVLGIGFLQRALSPALFLRFSGEAGLWEPLTVLCYAAAGALLFERAGQEREVSGAKHWRLLGAVYVLLALEELDYFGIFGGLIGRIDGVYVGSPHDLVRLAAEGQISAAAALGAVVVIVAVPLLLLWWRGYVQPKRLFRAAARWDVLFAVGGLALIAAGALLDAGLLSASEGAALHPEELVELGGAILLAGYALQISAPSIGSGSPSGPAPL